jgi:hypothetical protein
MPWLYEIDGKRYKRSGLNEKEKIIDGISRCDLVVALYRFRVGSRMREQPIFYGTDFELFQARRLGKPVLLYVLGPCHSRRLRGLLEIYAHPLVMPDGISWCNSERELPTILAYDISVYAKSFLLRSRIHESKLKSEAVLDRGFLEKTHDTLAEMRRRQDYWSAVELASQIPPLPVDHLPTREKSTYANIMSLCANAWSNQRNYDLAENYSRLAIRSYLELGLTFEMFAEVQCLSGILNMGDRVSQAYEVNTYGRLAASAARGEVFNSLSDTYYDSRASILRKMGHWSRAQFTLRKVFPPSGDASPYTYSKYATMLNSAGDRTLAERIVNDVALPLAKQSGESLGYVARDAAMIAITTGEFGRAVPLLLEAEEDCIKHGTLHTLAQVQRLLREVQSRNQAA